jgi:hypothetical protein
MGVADRDQRRRKGGEQEESEVDGGGIHLLRLLVRF